MNQIPVITIDGPAGSGKGTIAKLVAKELGWHILDSGALYRLTAYAALQKNIAFDDVDTLSKTARSLDVVFKEGEIYLENQKVTQDIRSEECGNAASKVAACGEVREALLKRQHDFRQAPGLIADGRDMGTVVFTDAPVKIYLTASAAERGKRRLNQLKQNGIDASLPRLIQDIEERDERDMNRTESPLKPADDAIVIDSSDMSIEQVVKKVMEYVEK